MSSSDEKDWFIYDDSEDSEEEKKDSTRPKGVDNEKREEKVIRRKGKALNGNGNKKDSSLGGMIGSAKNLMEKYSPFGGGTTIISQNEQSKRCTAEMAQGLQSTLHSFLTNTSKVMRPLINSGNDISVGEPYIVGDCVRFTIEPFFQTIEHHVVTNLNTEMKNNLPGFSFCIGNPGGALSKKLRLQSPGSSKSFSVTVPTESMQPYFEFRPPQLRDRHLMLSILVLLVVLVIVVAHSFYASYSKEGYSLWTGLYEVFSALGIL